MAIEKGNQIWALRIADRTGNPRLYYPDELLSRFGDYYKWVQDNPLKRSTLVQKTGEVVEVPLGRPMSILAFCLYAGMGQNTFYQYAKQVEYTEVISIIKDAVYCNKFEGAAVGIFSAAIMVRDLGLSEVVTHVLDDKRKSISELFPNDDEILAIEAEETSISNILALNSESNGNED